MRHARWTKLCDCWDKHVLDSIQRRIASGPPVLFDGAIGSRLIQIGLPAGTPPEAWVLSHPERIAAVHREYVEAGSEVIAACTFGGNRTRLERAGLADQCIKINTEAVMLARQAASGLCWIAADLGPMGEFLQPHGPLTPGEAHRIFLEQADILARAGMDFFLLETHYDLREARICLAACREAAPQIPIAVSMTFNRKKRGCFTVMGDEAAQSLRVLHEEGAFLVGSNCTLESEEMVELAKLLLGEVKAPLLFQPNAGAPQITSEGIHYPQDSATFAHHIGEIAKLGARAVGGCCGTDGTYIKAMADMLKANR
jgi:5-methyltetrahydrofolate--homocysteine methyltransferase